MPHLTRRRDRNARQESWLIYYGDVQVGSIDPRAGNPTESGPWALRLLSGIASRRMHLRHNGDIRVRTCGVIGGVGGLFVSKRTEADFEACQKSVIGRSGSMLLGSAARAAVAFLITRGFVALRPIRDGELI
jgi:hypothetical protein